MNSITEYFPNKTGFRQFNKHDFLRSEEHLGVWGVCVLHIDIDILYLDCCGLLYGTAANRVTTCHCFVGKKTISNPYLGQLFSFFCWSTMVYPFISTISIYISIILLTHFIYFGNFDVNFTFWKFLFLFRICTVKPLMCITPTTPVASGCLLFMRSNAISTVLIKYVVASLP